MAAEEESEQGGFMRCAVSAAVLHSVQRRSSYNRQVREIE